MVGSQGCHGLNEASAVSAGAGLLPEGAAVAHRHLLHDRLREWRQGASARRPLQDGPCPQVSALMSLSPGLLAWIHTSIPCVSTQPRTACQEEVKGRAFLQAFAAGWRQYLCLDGHYHEGVMAPSCEGIQASETQKDQ